MASGQGSQDVQEMFQRMGEKLGWFTQSTGAQAIVCTILPSFHSFLVLNLVSIRDFFLKPCW